MKASEFNQLLKRAVSVEEFNTNNSWGFGGAIGKEWVFSSGWKVRSGRACYRHTGTTPFTAVYNPEGKRVYDECGITKEFEQFKQYLR